MSWRKCLTIAVLTVCCSAGGTQTVEAASVTGLGKGFPYLLNDSDHVVIAQLVAEEGEENLTGPWSIWAAGKSTVLKPINGPEKHESAEKPRHELFIGGINAAGNVGGSSTEAFTDEGELRGVLRPVWFSAAGEPHEVPVLQEAFTNKKSETFHFGGLGVGIDEAGDVAGTDGYQSAAGANVSSRGVLAPGGGAPVNVGDANLPAGGSSTVDFINASGEMLGATAPAEGEAKPTYYLWPNASSAGTALSFDTPLYLASDGTTLGERKGKVYIRLPEGSETEVAGIEKPFRTNASHVVVGQVKAAGAEHAAEWREGAVTDLNTQLPKGSGWVLERAVAINDGGDIVGVGSHEGKEEGFLLEAGLKSATLLSCVPAGEAGVARCTAKVSDASGEEPPTTPTGTVAFTASAGSFKEPKCELLASAAAGAAECSALYKQPTPPAGAVKLTASYGGDSEFAASSGSLTDCSNGQDIELESVKWVGRHDHGLEIGHEVVVHGCNMQAGDVLRWGNELSTQTIAAAEVSPDGTTVTTTLPWSATSGTLTLSDGKTTVSMAEALEVDTWRNTQGFNFPNYSTYATRQQFVDAFVDASFNEFGFLPPALEEVYLDAYAGTKRGVGQCFGFALTSMELADGTLAADRYGTAETVYGLAETPAIEETIQINWWKQKSRESVAALNVPLASADDIRGALTAAFGPNGFTHPAVISFFWKTSLPSKTGQKKWKWHGHAVTAFGVRDDYPEPGDFTILIYNSNVPFQPGESSADGALHAKAQTNSDIVVHANGEWSDPAEKASGPAKLLHVESASLLEAPHHIYLEKPGEASTSLAPGTGVVSVADPSTGKPVDLEDGGSGSVMLGAQIDGGDHETETPDSYEGPGLAGVSSISGPAGTWHESLGSTDGNLGAEWFGAKGAASISGGNGFAASTFDSKAGSLALAPATGEPTPSNATMQLYSSYTGGATEHVLTVSGPVVGAGVKAAFAGGGVKVSTTKAVKLHVQLSSSGAHTGGQTFDLGTVSIPAKGTMTVVPDWNGLAGARKLIATITAGRRHRRLKLRNHLHLAHTRIVGHSATGAVVKLALATTSSGGAGATLLVTATARHGTKSLGKATAKLTGSRHAGATLKFARSLPKGSRVTVTVATATGGTTPSSSKTTASFAVR